MKKTTASLAATAALALALTGCATGATSSDETPSGTNHPTTSSTSDSGAPEADAAAADTATEEPATLDPEDMILDFGQTMTYEDGVSLTVGEPKQVTPGPYAYPEVSEATAFDVTVVNGSDSAIDAAAYASVQSSNVEAEEVYDDGYDGPPQTALLPGREATWTVAFATTDPSDLVFQMSPTWEHHETIFTNSN